MVVYMTGYFKNKSVLVARLFEIVIGLYLIAGAIPKGLDIDKFAVQIAAYKVIENPTWLYAAALATLFAEIVLGFALISGLRLKGLVIVGLQVMLVVFSALIVYAWRVHGLEDCGCFPVFQMTPQVSLFKNAGIVSAGVYILWTFVWPARKFPAAFSPVRFVSLPVVGKAVVAVVLACVATGYAYQDIEWTAFSSVTEDGVERPFAQFEIYMPEGYFNLAEGTYLVPIMSMSCSECMEKAPELNDLWFMPDMPPTIALCYEDEPGDMEIFQAYAGTVFPMYSIGNRAMLFYSLLGNEPFRIALIHDGALVTAWDGYVPDYEEVIEVVESVYAS